MRKTQVITESMEVSDPGDKAAVLAGKAAPQGRIGLAKALGWAETVDAVRTGKGDFSGSEADSDVDVSDDKPGACDSSDNEASEVDGSQSANSSDNESVVEPPPSPSVASRKKDRSVWSANTLKRPREQQPPDMPDSRQSKSKKTPVKRSRKTQGIEGISLSDVSDLVFGSPANLTDTLAVFNFQEAVTTFVTLKISANVVAFVWPTFSGKF